MELIDLASIIRKGYTRVELINKAALFRVMPDLSERRSIEMEQESRSELTVLFGLIRLTKAKNKRSVQ